MATDTFVITAPNAVEPDFPIVLSADSILITPTGGTQGTLAALLGTGGTPSFTSVTTANLTVTGNITATATKAGFFGSTAVTQPTNASQASITDGSVGTANPTTGVDSLVGAVTFTTPITMASLANGQVYQFDPGFNGKLVGIAFRDTVAVTTSGKAATVQSQVNATNLTGGAIALSGTYALGAGQSMSAITGGTQTFTSAQTVGVSISGVTTFTEGSGVFEFQMINTDTANAISTMIAQGNAVRAALVTLGVIKGS